MLAGYRQLAWEIAVGQYGYVRTADAVEVGIPRIELVKLARNGRLDHVGYGVYRFPDFPSTRFDSFFEAVARVGGDAHLVGDSVLHLHGLAQVNPATVKVGTARRVRRALPDWVEVLSSGDAQGDVTEYEAIPSSTVAAALKTCRDSLIGERFDAAVDEARAAGLVTAAEAAELKER